MRAVAEAAIGAGDDILAPGVPGEILDALGHQLRMLDDVGGMRDHAGHEDLAGWQFGRLPDDMLMLVAGVRGFEQIGLRLHPQHDTDHVDHLDVVGMRAMPAAPTEMISDLLIGDVAQRVVQGLDPDDAALEECIEAHLDEPRSFSS